MLPQPSLPISQPVKSAKCEDVIGDAGLPPMPLTPSLSGQYPLNHIYLPIDTFSVDGALVGDREKVASAF